MPLHIYLSIGMLPFICVCLLPSFFYLCISVASICSSLYGCYPRFFISVCLLPLFDHLCMSVTLVFLSLYVCYPRFFISVCLLPSLFTSACLLAYIFTFACMSVFIFFFAFYICLYVHKNTKSGNPLRPLLENSGTRLGSLIK